MNVSPRPHGAVALKVLGEDTVQAVLTDLERAPIPEPLARAMQGLALRTYQAVECRDFGRVDIRVDRAGQPYVLEINPLPSLSTEDVFTFVAKAQGLTYEAIINKVVDAALVRHGLKAKEETGFKSAIRSR